MDDREKVLQLSAFLPILEYQLNDAVNAWPERENRALAAARAIINFKAVFEEMFRTSLGREPNCERIFAILDELTTEIFELRRKGPLSGIIEDARTPGRGSRTLPLKTANAILDALLGAECLRMAGLKATRADRFAAKVLAAAGIDVDTNSWTENRLAKWRAAMFQTDLYAPHRRRFDTLSAHYHVIFAGHSRRRMAVRRARIHFKQISSE